MNKKLNNNFSLRKLLLTALVAGPLATLPAPLWALPVSDTTNLTTSAGVTIQQIGTTTLNLTTPDKAVLTWQAFGSGGSTIANGDTINYFLPTAAGSVLNSVTGGQPSQIDGRILSNGNVYVLNPSGIVLGSTAQINAAGFYASTIAEPSGFFTINGSLSFQGTSTSNVVVSGTGASVQAVGASNVIYLAGKEVDVQGGTLSGNVFIKSTGTANSLGGASVRLGNQGAVTISQVNAPLVAGALNITTAGGNAILSGTAATTVNGTAAGALTVNTTGSGINGNITQGAGGIIVSATGSTVVLTAGGNSLASGDISLAPATTANNFLTVSANGKDVTISDINALALGSTVASNNLSITTTGGNDLSAVAGTTTSVGGTATIAMNTLTTAPFIAQTGRTVTFSGAGDITFAGITAGNTANITSTGNITLTPNTNFTSANFTSSGGSIIGTNGLTTTNALTLSAAAGKISIPVVSSRTATITAGSDITFATSLGQGGVVANVGTNQTVTSSGGNISIGAISTVTNLTLTSTAGSITVTGDIKTQGVDATATTLTANAGTISLQNVSKYNTATPAVPVAIGANQTVTLSAGSITQVGVLTTSTLKITATTGSIDVGTLSVGRDSPLTATATGGNVKAASLISTATNAGFNINSNTSVVLPGSVTPFLTVNSAAGSITQATGTTISSTGSTGNRVNLTAATDITLLEANDFNILTLNGGTAANSFQIVDANGIILNGNTSANAPTTITAKPAGGIQIGSASTDSLTFASTLNLKTEVAGGTGAITTTANSISAAGGVTLTTNNSDAMLGNPDVSSALVNYKYGQVNAALGTGNLKVVENTSLNLGAITAANITSAVSIGGDIVNSGALVLSGTAKVAAGSIFVPLNVSLNNASNAITGTVYVSNAADFALVNTKTTIVELGTTDNGRAASGTTSVTVTGASANTLTIRNNDATAPTPVARGDLNIVSFSAPGQVTVSETGTTNGIVLQNLSTTGSGTVTVNASGPVVLGSGIVLGSTAPVSITATGDITDNAPNIRINSATSLTSSAGSINIAQTGHTLGQVSLTTGLLAGNISYTEGGSANIKSVGFPAAGTGNLSLTSTGGDILQGTGANGIRVPATAGSVTLSAPSGAVSLTNPDTVALTNNSILRPITITAANDSAVAQGAPVTLGNVRVATGGLTVNTAATWGNAVNQAADTNILSTGATAFNTLAGVVTLDNAKNNFGGLTIATQSGAVQATSNLVTLTGGVPDAPTVLIGGTGYAANSTIPVTVTGTTAGTAAAYNATSNGAGVITGFTVVTPGSGYLAAPTITVAAPSGANASVTEQGTLNFTAVNTGSAGTLTAVSAAGGIIQNGTGGVKVGGNSSFTASADGIALASTTTNNFGGKAISLNTAGAVSIQDAASVTVLGGSSTIGGNLSIKNTLGTGEIKDSPGTLTVAGTVLFDTTTNTLSKVTIGSSTANFGAITFRSGVVTIVENADLNLAAGSVATKAVSLTSSGNITSSGNGGATFQDKLDLNASGGITITNPIFVNGAAGVAPGLTFRALGVVNLGALSLAGNLNSIAPINLGASSYTPPAP